MEATSKACRQCGKKFIPAFRAGRDSNRRRPGGERPLSAAEFCSARCKQANYRWRANRKAQEHSRNGEGPGVRSAVTPGLEGIEKIEEKTPISGSARPLQIAGPPLTPSQLHCAGLPLDSMTAEVVRRANRETYSTKPYLPMANLELSREATVYSDWKPTGTGIAPEIPQFLLRR